MAIFSNVKADQNGVAARFGALPPPSKPVAPASANPAGALPYSSTGAQASRVYGAPVASVTAANAVVPQAHTINDYPGLYSLPTSVQQAVLSSGVDPKQYFGGTVGLQDYQFANRLSAPAAPQTQWGIPVGPKPSGGIAGLPAGYDTGNHPLTAAAAGALGNGITYNQNAQLGWQSSLNYANPALAQTIKNYNANYADIPAGWSQISTTEAKGGGLVNTNYVRYDPKYGLITPTANVHADPDSWGGTLAKVGVAAAFAWAGGAALGSAIGGTEAGAAIGTTGSNALGGAIENTAYNVGVNGQNIGDAATGAAIGAVTGWAGGAVGAEAGGLLQDSGLPDYAINIIKNNVAPGVVKTILTGGDVTAGLKNSLIQAAFSNAPGAFSDISNQFGSGASGNATSPTGGNMSDQFLELDFGGGGNDYGSTYDPGNGSSFDFGGVNGDAGNYGQLPPPDFTGGAGLQAPFDPYNGTAFGNNSFLNVDPSHLTSVDSPGLISQLLGAGGKLITTTAGQKALLTAAGKILPIAAAAYAAHQAGGAGNIGNGPLSALQQAQVDGLRQQQQIGADQYADYKSTYRPLEHQYAAGAFNNPVTANYEGLDHIDPTARVNEARTGAFADSQAAIDSARGQTTRALTRYGVNPNSGKFAGALDNVGLRGAALTAGNVTQTGINTRNYVDETNRAIDAQRRGEQEYASNTNFARQGSAINVGRGLPANAAGALGSSASGLGGAAANQYYQDTANYNRTQGQLGNVGSAVGSFLTPDKNGDSAASNLTKWFTDYQPGA